MDVALLCSRLQVGHYNGLDNRLDIKFEFKYIISLYSKTIQSGDGLSV